MMGTAVQVLVVLVSGAVTLGVTLLVQRMANRRENDAVRNQVEAMLRGSWWLVYDAQRSEIGSGHLSLLDALLKRLGDKDVALALRDNELTQAMKLVTLMPFYLDAANALLAADESAKDAMQKTMRNNARYVGNAIMSTLAAMGAERGGIRELDAAPRKSGEQVT